MALFKKSANATHHFFNQRLDQARTSTSVTRDNQPMNSATIEVNQGDFNPDFDESREGNYFDSLSVPATVNKRKSHTSSMVRRAKTNMDCNDSLLGTTYPNVPLKSKLGDKGRKKQLSNVVPGATSTWNSF